MKIRMKGSGWKNWEDMDGKTKRTEEEKGCVMKLYSEKEIEKE